MENRLPDTTAISLPPSFEGRRLLVLKNERLRRHGANQRCRQIKDDLSPSLRQRVKYDISGCVISAIIQLVRCIAPYVDDEEFESNIICQSSMFL